MNNLEIALCDLDSDYIFKLANHLMMKTNVSVHIFTSQEGFFSDETDFDVSVYTEDFEEIIGFRPKGMIGHKYLLTESAIDEREGCIYKFQAVDNIFREIKELRILENKNIGNKKSEGNSMELIGVYSPDNHELQLPFTMALAQTYRTKGKVLFLDLEENSILPNLVGKACERNLMDLLYYVNSNAEDVELNLLDFSESFMGIDYIMPFSNPNEISEIDEETWERLFETLMKTDYEEIVILYGRTISGFSKFIGRLSRLFVLGRQGDYFRKARENFCDYLERIEVGVEYENVILPMSAGNLTDGAYQLEELLQGNLGIFVKRLINNMGKNVLENYG